MIGSRLIKSNDVAAGCEDIVDNYDPFGGNGVALYQLNGDALDLSPNGYDAASTSGITWGTAGVFGTSASYNGSTSNIRLPDNLSVATGSNDFTLSAWVYLDTFNPSFTSVITTQANWYFYITIAPDGQVKTYNQVVSVNSSVGVISTGQWYHIGATLSSTSGKNVYVNGVNVASSLDTSNCLDRSSSNGHNALGYYNSTGTTNEYHIDGKIDQVRIFNTALTPLEVEALYTEELCICDGTVDTLDILGDGSCIATYQLDGNANDLSGNYSGTPTDVSYGVGEFDLAGVFNGSTSAINTTYTPTVANLRTVSLWFKTNSTVLGAIQSVSPYGISNNYAWEWIYMLSNGTIAAGYGASNGGAVYMKTTTNSYNDNSWHHLALTLNGVYGAGSFVQLYIDGNEVSTSIDTSNSGSISSITGTFRLGSRNRSGVDSNVFNGSIDQVRIFNKALSAGEVTTLYNETACTKAACTGTTNTLNILGGGDTSCIAAYPLDGSPADLSGNYNGVQTDVTYPQGYFDLAGSFNGSTSYIDNLPTITNIASSFSVSLWFKSSVTPSKTEFFIGAIANQGAGTNKDSLFLIQINSSEDLSLYVRGTDEVIRQIDAAGSYSDGNWHHVVATVSTTTAALYVDDNLINTANADDTITVNNLVIGARDNRGTIQNFFTGQIDQVRIFNKVLSAGDVTTLNNETPCN